MRFLLDAELLGPLLGREWLGADSIVCVTYLGAVGKHAKMLADQFERPICRGAVVTIFAHFPALAIENWRRLHGALYVFN